MTETPNTSGKAWPIGIGVGLGFVVVANAVMITIAYSHPSAPAVDDHWVAAQGWDAELEQRQRSAALGWSVAKVTRSPAQAGLVVELVDRAGAPVEGLRGTAAVSRADSAAHDARTTLVELGGGRYLAPLEVAPRGLTWLDLDLQDGAGQRFVRRETVELDKEAES